MFSNTFIRNGQCNDNKRQQQHTSQSHCPRYPPPSSPKDPKQYPLLNTALPKSLRKFPLCFPNGARATFKADLNSVTVEDSSESDSEEATSGRTWRMLKREETAPKDEVVGFDDALERFGRKRLLSSFANDSVMMEGIESSTHAHPLANVSVAQRWSLFEY